MDRFLQDIHLAARSLARSPGFTTVALLTLALGIGANAAMFSIVNGVLLRPLPYAEPDELVRLHQASPEYGLPHAALSPVDFDDWHERTRSFAAMAAYATWELALTERGDPVELRATYVTEEFFDVLGTGVQAGRPLGAEDIRQASRNAVISDRLWRARFAADPGIVGQVIRLGGQPVTVVGIASPTFRFPEPDVDVWVPQSLITDDDAPRTRDNRYLMGVARLRAGVTAEQAQAELTRVARELATEYPETNSGWNAATVVPLRTAIVGDVDQALVVVLGVVGLILLIGCTNLANLLLARGSARSREIAIRTALGAGRTRIVQQLLTESLLLALLGGVLGLVLSVWCVEAVLALSANTLPRMEDVQIDGRVLGFGLILTLATGLIFGLVPALRSARTDPHIHLSGGRGTVGSGGQRLRKALVVAEVTLAVVLVMGAGLMARSFVELRRVDPGFDPARVLTVSMELNEPVDLSGAESFQHTIRRKEEIIERVGALPGVVAVGTVNTLPLQGEGEPFEFRRADGSGTGDGSPLRADARFVSPDYFRAMGIPFLRGAPLSDQQAESAPVPVLVSETAARRFWPGEDPVGQTVRLSWGEAVVTGIVGDVRQLGLHQEPPPAAYLSQTVAPRSATTLVVRTAGDPLALANPIRQIIQELDPNQPIRSIATLGGVMSESIAQDRFFTLLFGIFGGLALVLATLGIYGVLAYSVNQRTQEIGVRMALGASAADVLRMVIGVGMMLVGVGVVLGTAAALLLTRVLESQLYGVSATDPLTFVAVPAILAGVALLASYIPARRATRVDPMVALRAE